MNPAPPTDSAELSDVARIALAYAGTKDRPLWWTFFALDGFLARIARTAREPLLAQLRLSWWRDELGKRPVERTAGNAILDCAGRHWRGEHAALIALVDGWEHLLGETPLAADSIRGFAQGRGIACEAIARALGVEKGMAPTAIAGERWAFAELAAHTANQSDRSEALDLARALPETSLTWPRSLRPLAILDGLSRRSVARGGAPLLGDRLSPLAALRLGMMGR